MEKSLKVNDIKVTLNRETVEYDSLSGIMVLPDMTRGRSCQNNYSKKLEKLYYSKY